MVVLVVLVLIRIVIPVSREPFHTPTFDDATICTSKSIPMLATSLALVVEIVSIDTGTTTSVSILLFLSTELTLRITGRKGIVKYIFGSFPAVVRDTVPRVGVGICIPVVVSTSVAVPAVPTVVAVVVAMIGIGST